MTLAEEQTLHHWLHRPSTKWQFGFKNARSWKRNACIRVNK